MADTTPSPRLSYHAYERFNERIEPVDAKELQAWVDSMWAHRNKSVPSHIRTALLKRVYNGVPRDYLSCRSPGGKPVFLSLSHNLDTVMTVLDIWQWNLFVGSGKRLKTKQFLQDELIRKLRQEESC
jgi:hypothetical protein